jgi:DNA repair protein RecN (Recombination protein N)
MLRELSIKDFAIIDDLRIRLDGGLTILSGETGAGKSIIINAVNLLLGSRASDRLVRTGEDAAELEALFEIRPGSPTADLMRENDFDPDEGLMVRRIISTAGRHRVYINGRLSTMKLLAALTENLASISGQHAHQGLLDEESHLLILDQLGGLMPLRDAVAEAYEAVLPLLKHLEALKDRKARQAEQIELLTFQREEIQAAEISPGEDAELEGERVILKNSETLYRTVYEAIEELYSAQNAIVERLGEINKRMERACEIDPELGRRAQGIEETTFQIEDIVQGLRDYLSGISMDDGRLDAVEARLDALLKLKRKYGAGSIDDVLNRLGEIEDELSRMDSLDDEIAETEAAMAEKRAELLAAAETLTERRKATAEAMADKVVAELETLKMGRTRFEIPVTPIPAGESTPAVFRTDAGGAVGPTGADRATFMIAPNVGEDLKPLAGIASGGELSRVVLALKAILAQTEAVETVIFDEVDAGVGGSIADVVGRKLADLAAYHQVICITHLPQIARFAHHHFRIEKRVDGGRTRTSIVPLDLEDRVQEIARMMGGVKVTRTTLDHAREMLSGF